MSTGSTFRHDDPRRIAPGLWREILRPFTGTTRSALFLDRDGVLNRDTGYVGDPRTLEVWTDTAPLVRAANRRESPVVVVTNQSGIARGYYGWGDFDSVNRRILKEFAAAGATIDAILACAYHEEGLDALAVADHPWRKPRAGMLLEAARLLPVALETSFIVGDRKGDMEAAAAAGLKRGLMLAPDDKPARGTIDGFTYDIRPRQTVDWPEVAAAAFPPAPDRASSC
ncbi:HAD family hydrolase [Stappia indica]|uniref:HAD family hydrolase n=1 Tax=Stappia indica TaxID=538381 RepID=UPI001CD4722A|nr:HAD family hydrolase [Stappia indica]MCA1300835.1 HAD family hydrolase [Stappia indica]